jgi:undecaprenyl-diphosphatase
MSIPIIVAGTVFELFSESGSFEPSKIGIYLVGAVTAFIFGLFAIRIFIKLIKTKGFSGFAFYLIGLAMLLFVFQIY